MNYCSQRAQLYGLDIAEPVLFIVRLSLRPSGIQCESKNPPPRDFLTCFRFPKRLGIFSQNFTRLLRIAIYATHFYSIISNDDEVMPY